MKSKELILREINGIAHHETKLYSYLYDLVYKGWSTDTEFLEKIYNSFLDDPRTEIKRIAIYALLFGLKIKNDRYKEIALRHSSDINEYFDLRLFCLSGLGQAYMGSKDLVLLSSFYKIYRARHEDDDIRGACFEAIMAIMGMTSTEIVRRNNNALIWSFDDINEPLFNDQIELIEKILCS